MLKNLAKAALREMVQRFPWGANEAIFEALYKRMGPEQILARCMPALDHMQLCATGEYGLMQSALNDGLILPAYARTGIYEPRLAELFSNFFARHGGGTYLDIGANIGLTTIPVARDPAVHYLAFEPDPVNNRNLRANVKRNCPNHNVTVHEVALFSRSATLDFAKDAWNLGDHYLSPHGHSTRPTIQVEAAPLDQFRDDVTGAVAAKIDTQGAEPFVIAGGREVLSHVGLLAIEFCPYRMRTLGSDPDVVLDFLSTFARLAVGTVKGDDLPAFRPAADALSELRSFLATSREGDSDYRDVFAVRDDEVRV